MAKSHWRGLAFQGTIVFMVRVVTVLLLIVGLLNCPLHCSGGPQSDQTADTKESAGSCCCASHRRVPAKQECDVHLAHEQVPPLPGQCECTDCLCKGAVLTEADTAHDTFLAALWATDLTPPPSSLTADHFTVSLDGGPPEPVAVVGRPLRLLVQSLQI